MYSRILAFKFAGKGLWELLRTQPNFLIHLSASIIVVAAGFYFGIAHFEWLALILTIGFVLVTEVLNTAAEYIVDLVSPEHHALAGKIKDIAAGAVLLAAIIAIAEGILIFGPHLLALI